MFPAQSLKITPLVACLGYTRRRTGQTSRGHLGAHCQTAEITALELQQAVGGCRMGYALWLAWRSPVAIKA
jgi:hypothetical protein